MRKDKDLGVPYCQSDVQTEQLWRNKATGATHRVSVCAGGVVHTRSVDGGFQGSEADFLAGFVWIVPAAEKLLQQPSTIKRRQRGSIVRRNQPKAASKINCSRSREIDA